MRTGPWPMVFSACALSACISAACEPAGLPLPEGNNVCDAPSLEAPLPEALEETSGIAASRAHRGVFWSHNDSGGDPAVFAIDSTGTVRARVRVEAAFNRDWEDIAVGPCEPGAGEDCLFIAETGDNAERHRNVAVYRIPEPDPTTDTVSAPADILRFTYPDGPRDAESIFVTEAGINIINKGRSDAIELFRLEPPYRATETVTAQRVQQLAPPPTSHSAQVTAAAVDPGGNQVVVRSYSGLRFFEIDADTLRPHGRAADVVAPRQQQGEGVDFAGNGRFILTSESRADRSAALALVYCDPTRPPADTTPEN